MDTVIGILGGMGPEATNYLFAQILKHTDAGCDREHIPIVVYNNPKVPDRTAAILSDGPSPSPAILEGARFLEKSGASFILMPCITAHYFHPEVSGQINIPFLHLVEETASYVRRRMPHVGKLGLLSTRGTQKTGLFQTFFEAIGREIVVPDESRQPEFGEAVYGECGIKSGYKEKPGKMLARLADHLIEKGAEAIIAGCTEVPLALTPDAIDRPLIDPLEIGARVAILKAGYPVR